MLDQIFPNHPWPSWSFIWLATIRFLYYITPALVTVSLGAFLVQKFFVRRSNEAAMIDLLVREFDTLRNDAIDYWSNLGRNSREKQQQVLMSQKIKISIKSIFSDLNYYCGRYCPKQATEIKVLMMDVSDACTGGDFESLRKSGDEARYLLINNAINTARTALLRRKI